MLLKVEGVKVYYSRAEVLKGVSLELEEGELVAVLGANGAGKSTILRVISGLAECASGQVLLRGERIDKLPPHLIVARGISHVPEGRQIFPFMTVYENLKMGGFTQKDAKEYRKSLERVYELFPILQERGGQAAGTLSGGEQQMLAIGRSLMSNPGVLLMDEPSIGLSPIMVSALSKAISELNRSGKSIILVEQNASIALKLAQRGYVLEVGRVILKGSADSLANNKLVKDAYLGG